jgi:hypothetical protein
MHRDKIVGNGAHARSKPETHLSQNRQNKAHGFEPFFVSGERPGLSRIEYGRPGIIPIETAFPEDQARAGRPSATMRHLLGKTRYPHVLSPDPFGVFLCTIPDPGRLDGPLKLFPQPWSKILCRCEAAFQPFPKEFLAEYPIELSGPAKNTFEQKHLLHDVIGKQSQHMPKASFFYGKEIV